MQSAGRSAALWLTAAVVAMVVFVTAVLVVIVFDNGNDCPDPAAGVAAAAGPVAGQGLAGMNEHQLADARTIVAVGEAMGVPPQGIVIALATASRESHFRMYANSNVPDSLTYPHDAVGADHASVNEFQQQVGIWGTTAELMNADTAARLFYTHLLAVPGWQSMPLTEAASDVQHPREDLRGAYAAHEPLARTLYTKFKGAGADLSPAELAALRTGAGPATAAAVGGCGQPTPGGGPVDPSAPFGARVVAYAKRWLGTWYAWGGGDANGPTRGIHDGGVADSHGDYTKTGFDCSGLVLYAVAQASGGRIILQHNDQAQITDPRGVAITDPAQLEPGDIIQPYPGHIWIWEGHDTVIQAPESGEKVEETHWVPPASGLRARRFGTTAPNPSVSSPDVLAGAVR